MTVYAVRVRMVDGAIADLLQFINEPDAEVHADYIRQQCRLLGYDKVWVVRRRVIGKEPLERRRITHQPDRHAPVAEKRRC